MNKTKTFLTEIDALQKMEIPAPVLARIKQSLLDYIAVATAGAAFQKEKIRDYMEFAEPEPGAFTVVGTGKRLALNEAVFLNGLNAHALDFDDGTNSGIIHLGTPVFSVLLSLAERYDTGLDRLLRAAVIGYETSYTIAVSIQPGHKGLGYHATGTCGVLGAVIAASYMLDFTEEERFHAFAAACVASSGMLLVLDDGSELKPYNVAKTSLLALTALRLGKAGFKGHPDPLGADRGFLKMMGGSADIEIKPLLLKGTYAVMKSYTKPYASCRYTHPSVEAAIHLRDRYGLTKEDVEEIDVRTYSLAVSNHDHTEIPGSYSAKMSIPYATAAGLIFGRAGLQEFTEESVKDEGTLSLTRKVRVSADEELSRMFPDIQAAVVDIRTKDGRVLSDRVDFPKGEPENRLTDQEFRDRYMALMEYGGRDAEKADRIYRTAYEDGITARSLMALV